MDTATVIALMIEATVKSLADNKITLAESSAMTQALWAEARQLGVTDLVDQVLQSRL